MNTLMQTGEIELLKTGDSYNPIYLLGSNCRFYSTEHKIMESVPSLLSCYKGTVNGQTELIYLTEGLIPLDAALPQMEEDDLLVIGVNICKVIDSITANGFLNWQHIDLSENHIYIQPSDKSVHLVYLPVEGLHVAPGYLGKEISALIASFTKETKDPDAQKLAALRSRTSSFNGSLMEFSDYLLQLRNSKNAFLQFEHERAMILCDEQHDCRIIVDKPRFSIGKKASAVDGLITYSKFVGRVHCQIVNQNGDYYVYDLESRNGTFVNEEQVVPEEGTQLKEGDQLKLADVKFAVSFEEV